MRSYSLAAAREAAHFSQSEAARRLGLSRHALRDYEDGRTAPRADVLAQVYDLYRLSDAELRALVEWCAARVG